MPRDSQPYDETVMTDLLDLTARALEPLRDLLATGTEGLRTHVHHDGRIDPAALDAHQTAAHGLGVVGDIRSGPDTDAELGRAA